MKRLVLLVLVTVTFLTGCMTTRNGNKSDNIFPSGDGFNNKRVAILPVKSQTSLTTDSQTPLKKALNNKIVQAVKAKLPNTQVIDPQKTLDVLNDAGKIDLIEKMLASYESTGTFDKKLIANISSSLNSDYLVLTKLKVEKLDLSFLAKSFTGSLEVMLLDKRASEPLWSGIGDFKRMGTYGAGGTETDEAASELVTLAFGQPDVLSKQSTQISTLNPAPVSQPLLVQDEKPEVQPAIQPIEKNSTITPILTMHEQKTSSSETSMIVTEGKAKIRKKPSSKAAIVKSLKRGEKVTVVKRIDPWIQVELESGDVGWCLKSSFAQSN